MTPEQVIEALGVSEEAMTEENGQTCTVGLTHTVCFGEETDALVFSFRQNASGSFCLVSAEAIYPDEADMEVVLRELQETYGETSKTFTRLQPAPDGQTVREKTLIESEHFAFWNSEACPRNYLAGAKLEQFREMARQAGAGLTGGEDYTAYLMTAPLCQITWTDDAGWNGLELQEDFIYAQNRVRWSGTGLIMLAELDG